MTWLLLWTFILQYVLIINATSIFSVVGPDTIRSNTNYEVSVTLHESDRPCQIKVSVDGPWAKTYQISIQPLSTYLLSFDLPKLPSGDYQLVAEGVEGIVFRKSTKLTLSEDKASIYIQTDKATYKPGDLLQFRVLFLDRDTKPARIDKPITIEIHDGDKNRIKLWKEVKPTKGVFSGELQLSDRPVLGNWTIAVAVQGEGKETKVIKVDKYVLPKFGVRIRTSGDVVAANGLIEATIFAKYSFGKPVKGTVTVSIEGGWSERTVAIDGMVNVELPFDSTEKSPLKVVATVTEELTDLKQNSSAYVTLHQNRYKLLPDGWPQNFRPGQNLFFRVAVSNVDGSRVMDSKSNVRFHFDCCGVTRNTENPIAKSVAITRMVFPDTLCGKCQVTATFGGAPAITQSITKLEKSLRIEVNDRKHKEGQLVEVQVISSEYLPHFMFTIVARGRIVFNKYVQVAGEVQTQSLTFRSNFDLVPQATLFVHYVVNGVMRFDEKTIEIEKVFGNSIEIEVPKSAEPGDFVNLAVKTNPYSFVGLLAVDQSVLFLSSGNDLSHEHILNDLGKYASTSMVTLTNANISSNQNWGPCTSDSESCGVFSRSLFKASSSNQGRPPAPSQPVQKSSAQGSPPPIRQEFPETWLFMNITEVGQNGVAMVHKKVPDTITSWVVTGFSLNPDSGIATTKGQPKLRVFRPFFVSINLPYSVKRGEVISVPVVVFNYLGKPVEATVTMDNSDEEYEFSEVVNENEAKEVLERQRTKRLWIPADTGRSLTFMIRTKRVGLTTLKITASCPVAQDTIHQRLKVEANGVTKYVNKAILVKVNRLHRRSVGPLEKTLQVELPTDIVPGSEVIEFEVGGDLQAPVIEHLDNLVNLPNGCGEQTMINFVPNILVLRYLQVTRRNAPSIEAQARKYLVTGYQRELTFRKGDGSFSVFQSSASSTWLTAYVIRSFHMAANFTYIEYNVVTSGLDFLASKQQGNGEFPENGALYSEIKNPLAFTSYVLLTFFENTELRAKYQRVIDRGLQFVVNRVDHSDDQFSMAIAALVLAMARHPKVESVLARLESMARRKNDLKWWSKSERSVASHDVELTSYVLLAMLEHGVTDSPMPIVQWLVAQRNSNGGFGSTHDTVVGLQALTNFALQAIMTSADMDVGYTVSKNGRRSIVKVTPDKALKVQTHELPSTTREVHVSATGSGVSLVQLSSRHNVETEEARPSFKLATTVKNSPKNRLELKICFEYTPVEASDMGQPSNMAVMEVQLPSGYIADDEDLANTKSAAAVKIAETKKDDTMVVVYFDSLRPGDPKCVMVTATRVHAVAMHRPSYVVLYDYYVLERRATQFYSVSTSLCEICQEADCGSGC
ncbi:CD109 antigen-like [Drosophila elegans]|uniref:CD109 antigen-like n=1 Tax=Drosophila elegans TaxID=30023 RepID=UPI0007E717D4|nr:CD109 antigen-like [Drosophila elegans]